MNKQPQRKPTNAELQRRIKNALLFVPKTKDTKSVFFSDKGLRLTVNEDVALVGTGYHTHVFSNFTAGGVSVPFLYVKTITELGLEYGIVKDEKGNPTGYSYAVMLQTLKDKGKESEYDTAYYMSWYFLNIFSPLFLLGTTEAESFMVYLDYICNIARNTVLLTEHKEDMTNQQFVDAFIKNVKDIVKDVPESVILHKLTDEELVKQNADAIQEHENDELLKAQQKGGGNAES